MCAAGQMSPPTGRSRFVAIGCMNGLNRPQPFTQPRCLEQNVETDILSPSPVVSGQLQGA